MSEEEFDPLTMRVVQRYAFNLLAMSNLRPSDTGVEGVVIWVSTGEFGGADSQHGPRIKVLPGTKITPEALTEAVSVKISRPPKILGELPGKVQKQVIKFVNQNHDTLLAYWAGDLSTREMLDAIKPI